MKRMFLWTSLAAGMLLIASQIPCMTQAAKPTKAKPDVPAQYAAVAIGQSLRRMFRWRSFGRAALRISRTSAFTICDTRQRVG